MVLATDKILMAGGFKLIHIIVSCFEVEYENLIYYKMEQLLETINHVKQISTEK